MIRTLALSTTLLLAGSSLADAQMMMHRHHHHNPITRFNRTHHVTADGRCNGVSYGTGQRGCGTATGGPVGGLTNRN